MSHAEEDAIVARIVEERHGRVRDGLDHATAEGGTRIEGGPEAVQRYLDELKKTRGVALQLVAKSDVPPPPNATTCD